VAKPRVTCARASRKLAQTVCAQSQNGVRKVVSFANDDVPKFLQNLKRFEEESRKVQIVVK
jgi:hypothetical protein